MILLSKSKNQIIPSTEFISEWNMTAGSFTLPTSNVGTFDATIDWGDETPESTITTYNDSALTHVYASDGTYQIKINGSFGHLYINNNSSIDTKITKVISWGNVGFATATDMFEGAINLIELPTGAITGMDSVINFKNMFRSCTNLTSFPTGLFDNCTSAEDMSFLCYGASNFTTLPTDIFKYNTALTNLHYTFCNADLDSIPTGLLDGLTSLTDVGGLFLNCSTIPTIPSGLFDDNILITDFGLIFSGLENITTIPSGLFNNNASALEFDNAFNNCNSITAIPEGLFDYTTGVTNFAAAFNFCTSIQTIPETLYDNCNVVEYFGGCHADNITVTGVLPDLWNAYPAFPAYNKGGCFDGCTGATNYATALAEGWA